MNKTERAHLIGIVEAAQACHIGLGNFLAAHSKAVQAASGSIYQLHCFESSEAFLENLLLHQSRLANSFGPLERQIAFGFFEKDQEILSSFPFAEDPSFEPDFNPEINDPMFEEPSEPEEATAFRTPEDVLDYLNNNESKEETEPLLRSSFVEQSDNPKLEQEIKDEIKSRLCDNPPSPPKSEDYADLEKEQLISEGVRMIRQIQFMIRKHGLYYDRQTSEWMKPNEN